MKKILKYYLPITIFFLALGIFFLVYMVENHMAVLKYVAGEVGLEGKGRIISSKVKAVVKEDSVEQNSVKVFEDDGQLFLVFEKTENLGLGVLIVDRTRKDVVPPIVGDCYDFLFSSYLIQAECGQRGDYYGSEKHGGYRTKLGLNDSQINFRLPEYNYGKVVRNRQMEILFKSE